MMITETNGSSQLNLVIKSCISICITVLFAQSIFVLSPVSLAFLIETPEDQHENINKGDAIITGQIIQTISSIGSPAYQISKTVVATTTASSSSSSNTPTNSATGKSAVTKTPAENKVLIEGEESKKPFNPSPIDITT
ncbi:MAG: hypothetical protein WBP64_00740 [Nitrososphaeraceae archaeon]